MSLDRRKQDRSPSWVEASCHMRGGTRRARLTDVSVQGCRAEMPTVRADPGDRVLLKLTELLVLPATVAWVYDGHVGLEFANPMIGAMLNQFVLRNGKRARLH